MFAVLADLSRPSGALNLTRWFVRGLLVLVVVPYTLAAQTSSEDEHLHDHSTAHRIIEEIVTIGTRHRSRAAVDAPVPVDFFGVEVIESVNSSDLLDVIA